MTPDEHTKPVEGDGAPRDPAAPSRRLVSRRALVRAGWTVPVILALSHLPVNAFAQYACTHSDVPATVHTDVPGTVHTDVPATLHQDFPGIPPIIPHSDSPGTAHVDVPLTVHSDIAGTAHVDADICP